MEKPGTPPIIGIIGGSGLYDLEGLSETSWEDVDTPFGEPSDALLTGFLEGQKVVFLPRHGRGHKLSPSDLNYCANIYALKSLGVTEILSLSACGSFKEKLEPGTFVLVDQFIDRTFARKKTFFGNGIVAHVSVAHPTCDRLGDQLENAIKTLGISYKRGGTYLAMEGPQFSTLAESNLYRQWNCDVIGMTNMPEAKLAREAEVCYATVAMVTDYDCWHPDHDDVSVEQVVQTLMTNAENAKNLIKTVVPTLAERQESCEIGCHTALDNAIITARDAIEAESIKVLDPIVGRALGTK